MPTQSPTREVFDAFLAKLADPDYGFNARLADLAAERGLEPFVIDFTGQSANFYKMNLTPAMLMATSQRVWPTLTAYFLDGRDVARIKAQDFSGGIGIGLSAFLSSPISTPVFDFEDRTSLILDTVISVFNDIARHGDYPGHIAYNNDLTFAVRQATDKAGENWMQQIDHRMSFGIDLR